MKPKLDAGLSRSYILDGLTSMMSGFFIYRADYSGELLYINEAVLDIYDCADEDEFRDLTGYTFAGMIFPADLSVTEDNITSQISENGIYDKVSFRIRSKKDQIKYVEIQGKLYSSDEEGELISVTMTVLKEEEKRTFRTRHRFIVDNSSRNYILNTIDKAVKEDYIKIYYQPKFETSTGKLYGFEALSRWVDPKYGMLLPGEYVPVLEEYKLTHILDRYVMRQIAMDVNKQRKKFGKLIPVSFNLSHNDFLTFDPCKELIDITRTFDIPRDYFQVEISENTLNADPNLFKREIRRLRDNGFRVFIDDFGNEHSSLNTIREYEFDGILIDIGYMENFDEKSKNILKPVINMSKGLGIHTFAKGVETEEQIEYLRSVGCEIVQGYYYSYGRPSERIPDEIPMNVDAASKKPGSEVVEVIKKDPAISFVARQDLSEAQKVFSAISSIYNSIYMLDLEEDSYKEIKANYAMHRFLGDEGRISRVMPAIMRTFTATEYMEAVLAFTNPDTLADRLSERDYIETDFIGVINGWTTAAFFVLDRDESGKAVKILYTTRIIDESKKTEMDYKDVLMDMSKIYFSLIHIIFVTREFIPLILPDFIKDRLGMNQQPYELAKEMFIENYVSEDYYDKVNEFMDISTMQERLRKKAFISTEYYGKSNKWFRIIVTVSKTDEKGNVLRASMAMEDIDQEKNEQADLEFKIEHDALTGVLNRNAYDKYTELLKKSDMAIAYILLDVDRFKQINDTYGHGIGDSVLKRLACFMRNEFRLSDHIIRMGGDEFCVIMTGIEDKDAQMLIDKIYAINSALKNPRSKNIPKVSISAGIAFSAQGFTNDLYKKADMALYHTKNTTRDGYTIYDSLVNSPEFSSGQF
ncbi:diguanylate cyclase (GGDEF) domain-containing protein [Lachnospiraceae bacterium JC7]|nr:diguanylate cyclase (GGDEF) domain-containing protein [Lachnospiraceae bacterium JC7]